MEDTGGDSDPDRLKGEWMTTDSAADMCVFLQDASRTPYYEKHKDVKFWYERYDKIGLTERIGAIADAWVMDESNIRRAALQVGRGAQPASKGLVRGFCVCRFKTSLIGRWEPLSEGTGMDDEQQTVVCIALEHLSKANGFFMELKPGQDVCLDGKETIMCPPTGGGLALLVWFAL